ncbi:MAG: vWA domain-containing protein [Spirochaetia bacterium]
MTFLHPEAMWLALILVPLNIILYRWYKHGAGDLKQAAGKWRRGRYENIFIVKWFFQSLFYNVFVLLIVLALSGVSWGQQPITEERRGLDITFCIDISRSMLAGDVDPSRLERTAQVIRVLMENIRDARFNVVLFKGNAVQVIPFTEDTYTIESFLDTISPSAITASGTNIEAGIRLSAETLRETPERNQYILLFSDGENIGSQKARVIRYSEELNIPIFAIAAGTSEGSEIQLADGSYVVNTQGERVVSRTDIDFLRNIADASEGRLFSLSDSQLITEILSSISGMDGETVQGIRLEETPRYRIFVLFGLFCLLIVLGVRVYRWKDTF